MKIKLNHIGLNIQSKTELVDFYQNILDLDFEYQYVSGFRSLLNL